MLLLLIYSNFVFAENLDNNVIPQDVNLRPYSAIIGQDEQGKWQILGLKNLGNGRYGLELGSVTTQVVGSISTVIDKPVWEAQPIEVSNITLTIEVAPYATYTYTSNGFLLSGYENYLEYIVIVRNEPYPIDNYSFEFYPFAIDNETSTRLFLGAEVAPASGQAIFQPPIPIRIGEASFRFVLWNKSAYNQKLKVGLILSRRKVN